MNYEIPNSYNWFAKLNLTKFIPWNFETEINFDSSINERFKIECEDTRQVITFGRRQDMDTFAGFEIVNGNVTEKIIVFHPSFQQNVKGWNIIESEFINMMTNKLAIQIDKPNVWTNVLDFNSEIPLINKIDSYQYATAIGLALPKLK